MFKNKIISRCFALKDLKFFPNIQSEKCSIHSNFLAHFPKMSGCVVAVRLKFIKLNTATISQSECTFISS